MRIQHNIMAMNAYRNLGVNNSALSKNLEKLSSGYKINRAGDDAAGLAISEKMRAQVAGLDQAQKNAQSGINLVQTAEGALTEVHDMLNRMVTLATQAANGTYESEDRDKIQAEVDALISEIDRIATNSNFNGTNLLDGSLANTQTADLQVGTTKLTATAGTSFATGAVTIKGDKSKDEGVTATIAASGASVTVVLGTKAAATYTADEIASAVRNAAQVAIDNGDTSANTKALLSFTLEGSNLDMKLEDESTSGAVNMAAAGAGQTGALTLQIGADAAETISVSVASMKAASLGINGLDISDETKANAAIETIKTAIGTVSTTRGNLGAIQNRLEHTINNLGVMEENIQDAEANIRDTDIADEMMAYTKNNILIQSAQAMLAQANQVPQGVLQLMQ